MKRLFTLTHKEAGLLRGSDEHWLLIVRDPSLASTSQIKGGRSEREVKRAIASVFGTLRWRRDGDVFRAEQTLKEGGESPSPFTAVVVRRPSKDARQPEPSSGASTRSAAKRRSSKAS